MLTKKNPIKLPHKFYCPLCQQRLWRLGSQKRYLVDGKTVKKTPDIQMTKSDRMAIDAEDFGLEEFFCEKHGKMWMQLAVTSY